MTEGRRYPYQLLRRFAPPGAKDTHAKVKKFETLGDAHTYLKDLAKTEKLDTIDPHTFTILNLTSWTEEPLPTYTPEESDR